MKVVDIPIDEIQIINRMRKTDDSKIKELSESIKDIGLLHPITVAEKDNQYVILAGEHRYRSFKLLNRPTIPCVVRENNPLINQLVEVSENLCANRYNAIQESNAIVMREKILIKLGRKAVIGSNQYTENKLTNTELAGQLGISRRVYQYMKQISNLKPKVQKIIGKTKFANNKMDLVRLSQEPAEVQMEVANILATGSTTTFRRAYVLAKLRMAPDSWSAENKQLREEILLPKSIMKFERQKDKLNDICMTVSHNEELRRTKKTALFGTNVVSNYTMLPEHSRWFIKYFSNEGDTVVDNTFGRGTNILAAAYEGRKVIGFDLNKNNVECVREALDKYIPEVHHELFHSCGVEMVELGEAQNVIDLFINDIPYILSAEKYNDDPRDLCNTKDLDQFYGRVEVMMKNMKRLIKKSNYEEGIFKPIIMKVGSNRNQGAGLHDMATEIELIARRIGLTLHDKIFNELKPAMQSYLINTSFQKRFTLKLHETNLVFLDYG
jgi:ParB/RepB/Spo0J family partition protein